MRRGVGAVETGLLPHASLANPRVDVEIVELVQRCVGRLSRGKEVTRCGHWWAGWGSSGRLEGLPVLDGPSRV